MRAKKSAVGRHDHQDPVRPSVGDAEKRYHREPSPARQQAAHQRHRRDLGSEPGAVREALSRLSAEGLVIAESQKGYRVAPLSADELLDLTEARVEIERIAL